MIEKIEELLVEVNSFNATSKEEIENFRIKYNGKKGILNDFFEKFKEYYTVEEKQLFLRRFEMRIDTDNVTLKEGFLAMYANPVVNKLKYTHELKD